MNIFIRLYGKIIKHFFENRNFPRLKQKNKQDLGRVDLQLTTYSV